MDIILCGDLNCDLLRGSGDDKTKNFMDVMLLHRLTPLITCPTRITLNSATLIDNFFTNLPLPNLQKCILIDDLSDHLPTYCQIQKAKPNNKPISFSKVTNLNIESFRNTLNIKDWDSIVSNDVNVFYKKFIDNITDAYKSCTIKKSINLNKSGKTLKLPWIDQNIAKLCISKSILYKAFQENRNTLNENRYKSFRNSLNSLIRKKGEITFD